MVEDVREDAFEDAFEDLTMILRVILMLMTLLILKNAKNQVKVSYHFALTSGIMCQAVAFA